MKYFFLFIFGLGFAIGCLVYSEFQGLLKDDAKEIRIERNGKLIGYANVDMEESEFTFIKDAKNPGMFVAFPIYAGDQLQELLS